MPQNGTLDKSTQEQIDALLEILGQTQAQILAKVDKIKRENGQLGQELEERLLIMLSVPVLPPYP